MTWRILAESAKLAHQIRRSAERLPRLLGLDRNPLRRISDHIQTAVTVVTLIGILLGAPLAALAAGTAVDHAGLRAERTEATTVHRVFALLTGDAAPATGGAFEGATYYRAHARWSAPNGALRTGDVVVGSNAIHGSRTAVWVDATGRLAAKPRSHNQTTATAVLAAGGVTVSLGVLLWLLRAGVLVMVNRRRLDHWSRDWATVEPVWTGRTRTRPDNEDH